MPSRKITRKMRAKRNSSLERSSVGPMATSSPQTDGNNTHPNDTNSKDAIKLKFANWVEECRREFNTLLASVPPAIVNLPLPTLTGNNAEQIEKHLHVHWRSGLDDVINNSESNVFKTPVLKKNCTVKANDGCSTADSNVDKGSTTQASSSKDRGLSNIHASSSKSFAVVTPGPLMNKSVTVLRQPKAGETTVSLSGSPLLPSGGVVGKKATLTVPMGDGKIVTIIQPDNTISPSDLKSEKMFAELQDKTMSEIKEFASYLFKLLGDHNN